MAEARVRLAQAHEFVRVATLCMDEDDSEDMHAQAAAALAVLAGIAAADAVCCARLKQRHRGQDHEGAVARPRTVHPHGESMGKDLSRLLPEKDNAHYGAVVVSDTKAREMIKWATRLIDEATHQLTL
jgi:hypothetical protein